MFSGMIWGITFPWNLWITAAIGVWLMFSPHILDEARWIADIDHIIGALTVALSIIAMAEVARAIRFVNILFGVIAIILAFFSFGSGLLSHIVVGLALSTLAIPRGMIKESYGAWDRFIV